MLALGLAGVASRPYRLTEKPASATYYTVSQCDYVPPGAGYGGFPINFTTPITSNNGSGTVAGSIICTPLSGTNPPSLPVEGWPVTVTATSAPTGFSFSNGQLSISGYTNTSGNFAASWTNAAAGTVELTVTIAPEPNVLPNGASLSSSVTLLAPLAPTTATTAPPPPNGTVSYEYSIGTISATISSSCVGPNWSPPPWPTEIPTGCIVSTSPNWESVVNPLEQALAGGQTMPVTEAPVGRAPTSGGGTYTPAATTTTSTTSTTSTTDPALVPHAAAQPTGGQSGTGPGSSVKLVGAAGGGVPERKLSSTLSSAAIGGGLAGVAAAAGGVLLIGWLSRRRKPEREREAA